MLSTRPGGEGKANVERGGRAVLSLAQEPQDAMGMFEVSGSGAAWSDLCLRISVWPWCNGLDGHMWTR